MPILSLVEVFIAFIPAVMLKTGVIKRLLKVERSKALHAALITSMTTSFLALPLLFAAALVLLVIVMFAVMGIAWSGESPGLEIFVSAMMLIAPFEYELTDFLVLHMILGPLALLVPAYLIAVPCERLVLQHLYPEEDALLIDMVSRKMNWASFLFLAGLAVVLPLLLYMFRNL